MGVVTHPLPPLRNPIGEVGIMYLKFSMTVMSENFPEKFLSVY
jgi:hypothetical protein